MTREEILAALAALMEAAAADGDRPLTEEEADRYEALEGQLAVAIRSEQIAARDLAYRSAAIPGLTTTVADDGLERAFEAYLRTGQANQDMTELRDLNIGTPADGGYTVPDGFRQKLVEVRKAFGGLAEHADSFSTTTGQPLEYPTLDDTANVGAITAEAAAFADGADLVFGTVTLGAFKFTSSGAGTTTPLRVSVELLQDSAFDVQGLVSRALGVRIARKQARVWVIGSGSGEPQGVAGSSITENFDVDVHDVVDYDDLLSMDAALDPEYEANAKWLMSKATWSVLRALVDDVARPLLMENASAGIGAGIERTLLGYPVIIDQDMPGFPGAGDEHFIALGDWREAYAIRRVANLTVVVNPYSRANEGQVEFTAWERADGVVQNRGAYVLMANTAS
jgi:HK97 family phage major capsid protein